MRTEPLNFSKTRNAVLNKIYLLTFDFFFFFFRKQYDEAVKVFEHVAKKYQYPVIKTQLLKEIVMHGNAELLERVTNALADINGQVSSLLDLVATFAECNKPKQARRLLGNIKKKNYQFRCVF